MVDSTRGLGSSGLGGITAGIRDAFGRDRRAVQESGGSGGNSLGGVPNGPRGRRMLSPSTPVESLDRSAPRGTYLDILA